MRASGLSLEAPIIDFLVSDGTHLLGDIGNRGYRHAYKNRRQ